MIDSGLPLAGLAFGLIVSAFVLFQRFIARVEIGRRRWLLNTLVTAAIVSAIAAFAQGVGIAGGLLSGLSLLVGTAYFVLLALAGQSKQPPAFVVGGPLPDFTAPDETGATFDLSSLAGRPVLMKFFRGHW